MNWSDSTLHDHDASPDPVPDNKAAVPANGPLFLGDSGELGYDARRAACQLLAGPSIDAQRQPAQWAALLRNEAAIRSLLCDLFLELVMDRDAGFAFVRQADTGELEKPTLLRSSPLTFIDSVLLLTFTRSGLTHPSSRRMPLRSRLRVGGVTSPDTSTT